MDPLSVEERTLRMRFLLDEQLSPTLAARLHQLGHMAEHVSHVGLSGMPDHVVWRQAFERDAILVTVNAEDFISLAERYEAHAGLIILRNGELTAKEQGALARAGSRVAGTESTRSPELRLGSLGPHRGGD